MFESESQRWLKSQPKHTQEWLKKQAVWHDVDMFKALCFGAFLGFLMGVLAELPTKTGAWTLIQKIKEQAEQQLPKVETKQEENQ